MEILVAHERNDPKRQQTLREYLSTVRPVAAQSFRMTLFPHRVDPWPEKASWLRAGYLATFAALGYRYILDAALKTARDQIRNFKTDPVGWSGLRDGR